MKKYLFGELSFVFLFVMAVIWFLPKSVAIICAIVLVPMLFFLGWLIRPVDQGDAYLEHLGLQPKNYSQTGPMLAAAAIGLAAICWVAGVLCPSCTDRPDFWEKVFNQFKGYLLWAFAQQLLLLGYFANRLEALFDNKKKAALVAGGLFAIAHFPNPVLMPATAIFGGFGVYFFLKARNIWLATFFHALMGTAVKYLLANPLLDHGMRVGPGFWR